MALGVAAGAGRLGFAKVPEDVTYAMVAAQDRERVLRLAEKWVHETPATITSFPSPRSPGGMHDFFSEADYYWPNPAKPDGPYKEVDGKSNPDNFQDHRKAMIRLSIAVPALTAGYRLTKKTDYARAAAAHLLAWFVTPETRMTPNLQYSQGVRNGGPTGRSYGIIDTLHLVEVARAAGFVREFLSADEYAAVQRWFREYTAWMKTSEPGVKERWVRVQLPMQMAVDGSFPRETARTKPYGYSIFNFDVASALCWSLGGPEFERFALPDGRGMCKAAEFLEPYLVDKSKWPFARDVQHWESWPVRSPGLLFCGVACAKPEYVALWKTLDADPTDPESIRNFPVRQPVLWI